MCTAEDCLSCNQGRSCPEDDPPLITPEQAAAWPVYAVCAICALCFGVWCWHMAPLASF